MRIERITHATAKGWWTGAWNSPLPIAVGYATVAIDDPHLHQRVTDTESSTDYLHFVIACPRLSTSKRESRFPARGWGCKTRCIAM